MPDDFGSYDAEVERRLGRRLGRKPSLKGALSFPRGGELSEIVEIRVPARPEVLARGVYSGDALKTESAREEVLAGRGVMAYSSSCVT